MELGGLPWDFERETGASAVPQNGSALHHLVTAVSVKKALPGLLELLASKGSPTRDYHPGVASFRGDAKQRTRNPRIRRCAIAHLRSGASAPSRHDRTFCLVMLHAHTRVKMRRDNRLAHCADDTVKE